MVTRPRIFLPTALALGLCAVQAEAQTGAPPQTALINEHIAKAWSENGIKPSPKSTDHQFVRRAFIDLVGRIPASEEVRDFENDRSPNKRANLVHRLLHETKYSIKDRATGKVAVTKDYTAEYARHWANVWGVWLMTRGGVHNVYHEQMKIWLEEQFSKNAPHDEFVRKLLTASGRTNENQAVNFIGSHLGEATAADLRMTDGPFDAVPITSRVTRLFLGIQVQCVQCHDHPFNPEWKQDNFWSVNAFFRQVAREGTPSEAGGNGKKKMEAVQYGIKDDPGLNDKQMIFFEMRSGVLKPTKPVFLPDLVDLGADKPSKGPKSFQASAGKTRRQALAEFVVGHDNFAKAYVNRIWGHLFGRGLNEQAAADDFGNHNKVVHPELLDRLAEEFVKYRYDTKALISWIANSDAYSLSHVANKSNEKPEHEPFFGRMLLKAMSPEVLFDSLLEATTTEMKSDERAELREQWMSKLVRNFGDDEGNEVTFNGTIVQALLMMNGRELNSEISKKGGGTVDKALTKYRRGKGAVDEKAVLDELYLSALGRRMSGAPTIEVRKVTIDPRTKKEIQGPVSRLSESQFLMSQLADLKKSQAGDFAKDPLLVYRPFFEDVFWALLNTNEFILNH